jgi:transposase-like protein
MCLFRPAYHSDESVFHLLCLALRNIGKRWRMLVRDSGAATNQFTVIFTATAWPGIDFAGSMEVAS